VPDSQPRHRLSLTRPAWAAAIGLVCIAGYESIVQPFAHQTLEYVNHDQLVVVRMPGKMFEFPVLGARVELAPQWVYLSRTDPELADQPTFFSATHEAVVMLRPIWLIANEAMTAHQGENTTPPPPGDSTAITSEIPGNMVDPEASALAESGPGTGIHWFDRQTVGHEVIARFGPVKVPLIWSSQDDRRVGRYRTDRLDLVLVAIGPEHVIEEFCRGIRSLDNDR